MYYIGEEEIDAIKKVLEGRKLFRYQPDDAGECRQFEKEINQKFDINYSLLMTSGTNALITALTACGVGSNDEVIIPSYTFIATGAAVANVGAIPVIANIDETLCISPEDIKSKITDKTKAIIPVHIDGLACDMDSILEIARDNNLFVIEDTAQAIGGKYKDKYLGTIGDIGCFSFNEDKHIGCGEGGMAVTNNREYFEKIFSMHDASACVNPNNQNILKSTKHFLGGSMRVSEITGAFMRVQLSRLDTIISNLQERKTIMMDRFKSLEKVRIPIGNCSLGDSGSSIHFIFNTPEEAINIGKDLRRESIMAIPPTTRPGHRF